MTTIDEIRDIVFYIVRKLNNVIVNFTTEQPPLPTHEEIEDIRRILPPTPPPLPTHEEIMEEIEDISGSFPPTPPPQDLLIPQVSEEERQRINEELERIDAGVSELLRKVNEKPIPPPPPSSSPQEMIKKFIKQDEERIMDLQKQAHEKRIILNYLLDELIQRREKKEDANVIKLLEEEFERLRLERERLEKRIIELKEHIRFMQN